MKKRKSTVKQMMIKNSSSLDKKLFHQEILKCPLSHLGCASVFIGGTPLIQHLETDCNFFVSKASQNFRDEFEESSLKEKEKLTALIINKVKGTPIMESYDKKFSPCKMQTNYSVQTKKPDRFMKTTVFKKLECLKELDETENIELGSVPMKSNLACVFTSNKYKNKTFIAFRLNSGFAIMVKEVNALFSKKLEGHKDHISEIKYFRNEKDDGLLYSSSFDSNVIVWSADNFNALFKLDYGSWVLSSTVIYLRKQYCPLAFLCGGYFKKYPIKVYNLVNGALEFEIPITENISSEIIESYIEEEGGKYFLFVGSDNCDKPRVVWYDFKTKAQLGTFPATANVTSLNVEFCNKSLSIFYTDSAGVIRQGDLQTCKLVLDFRTNFPILDLLIWDAEYFLVCGSPRDNSVKIYTRAKTRLVKTFENNHSRVICNMFKCYQPHNGACLFTVGGDRKIKLQKLF